MKNGPRVVTISLNFAAWATCASVSVLPVIRFHTIMPIKGAPVPCKPLGDSKEKGPAAHDL